MIDRTRFFAAAPAIFGGVLTSNQKAGMNAIFDEWDRRGLTDLRHLAYMLATAKGETAHTMQPVREAFFVSPDFAVAEDWRRRNLRYWPYYGRGLPQLTWERNYREMTRLLKAQFAHILDFDMVKNPDQALIPEVAVAVMFEGMLDAESSVGDFTGLALDDFFNDTTDNPVGARKIINGTDHDALFADWHNQFLAALTGEAPAPRILQYGMQGDDVAALQRKLIGLGYDLGPAGADGDFGGHTKRAVIAFQTARGLTADGVAGPQTLGALGLV